MSTAVRVLDLYSCSGGAAWGYNLAGLDVARGVDIVHRPRYPFAFMLDDAIQCLLAHGRDFDFIHASPPCQSQCALT
ncbi:SAM-dependent methyltransferase, partial [[Kitasatospora] papulosa]